MSRFTGSSHNFTPAISGQLEPGAALQLLYDLIVAIDSNSPVALIHRLSVVFLSSIPSLSNKWPVLFNFYCLEQFSCTLFGAVGVFEEPKGRT